MATVADIFNSLQLRQWWNYPTQFFGTNGEMGTDFGMGATGTPVGSITQGTVIYVGAPYAGDPAHSSLGYVVQVLSPDGFVYHYQHLEAPAVHQGDVIDVGSVVGVSGGCPDGCYGSNGQCTCTDQWTTGEHIEVRRAQYDSNANGPWGYNWTDPYQAFLSLAGGVLGPGAPISGVGAAALNGNPGGSTSGGTVAANVAMFGQKAGLFILAGVLVFFGLYLIFKNQADEMLRNAKAGVAK